MHDGKTRIQILLDMEQAPEPKPRTPKCSPEERIERAMELVDSGHESKDEWKFLRWVNNSLTRKYQEGRINKREVAILKKIQPIMEKYGMLDPEGIEQDASLHTTTQHGDK